MNDYDDTWYHSDEKDDIPLIENIFELYDEQDIEQNDELRVLVDYLDRDDCNEDDEEEEDKIDLSNFRIGENSNNTYKSIDSLLGTVRRELEIPLIPDLANICMEYYNNYDTIESNIIQLCENRNVDLKLQEIEDDFERKDNTTRKRFRCYDIEEINKCKQVRRDHGEDNVSDDEIENSSEDERCNLYDGYDSDDLEIVHDQIDPSLAISRDAIVDLIDIQDITNEKSYGKANLEEYAMDLQRATHISEEAMDLVHVAAESYLIDLFKKAGELYDSNIPEGKLSVVSKCLFQS